MIKAIKRIASGLLVLLFIGLVCSLFVYIMYLVGSIILYLKGADTSVFGIKFTMGLFFCGTAYMLLMICWVLGGFWCENGKPDIDSELQDSEDL